MAGFSYKYSADLLSQKEKDRLVCVAITHLHQLKIDFEACADEYGGTKGSFRFAHYTLLKKLKDKNTAPSEETSKSNADTTTKTSVSNKKRKAVSSDQDDKEGGEEASKELKKDRDSKQKIQIKTEDRDGEGDK